MHATNLQKETEYWFFRPLFSLVCLRNHSYSGCCAWAHQIRDQQSHSSKRFTMASMMPEQLCWLPISLKKTECYSVHIFNSLKRIPHSNQMHTFSSRWRFYWFLKNSIKKKEKISTISIFHCRLWHLLTAELCRISANSWVLKAWLTGFEWHLFFPKDERGRLFEQENLCNGIGVGG